jgi:hypothetical protein
MLLITMLLFVIGVLTLFKKGTQETLINTSCSTNVPIPKPSILDTIPLQKTHQKTFCRQFANDSCNVQNYFIRNTKTPKLQNSKPPKTISEKCWKDHYNCCIQRQKQQN